MGPTAVGAGPRLLDVRPETARVADAVSWRSVTRKGPVQFPHISLMDANSHRVPLLQPTEVCAAVLHAASSPDRSFRWASRWHAARPGAWHGARRGRHRPGCPFKAVPLQGRRL